MPSREEKDEGRPSMKNFARDYIERGAERLKAAEGAMGRRSYPDVIRFSQEATELSLKSALRLVGVEYPKMHDVGDVLVSQKEAFPRWFAREIPWMGEFSRVMADKRSAAIYGVEANGKPPGEIFRDKGEARESLNTAGRVHEFCSRLMREADRTKP